MFSKRLATAARALTARDGTGRRACRRRSSWPHPRRTPRAARNGPAVVTATSGPTTRTGRARRRRRTATASRINSPDQKGGAVHVVGVPDISLDSFSVSADGNATVSVEGGSVGVAGSFSWTSGTLGVDVNLGPLSHGIDRQRRHEVPAGRHQCGHRLGPDDVGLSTARPALMMYDPHTITIGTGAALATIGHERHHRARRAASQPAKVVVNGLLEMGPGSLNLSTVELDVSGPRRRDLRPRR